MNGARRQLVFFLIFAQLKSGDTQAVGRERERNHTKNVKRNYKTSTLTILLLIPALFSFIFLREISILNFMQKSCFTAENLNLSLKTFRVDTQMH
jgi:hypothetical protein